MHSLGVHRHSQAAAVSSVCVSFRRFSWLRVLFVVARKPPSRVLFRLPQVRRRSQATTASSVCVGSSSVAVKKSPLPSAQVWIVVDFRKNDQLDTSSSSTSASTATLVNSMSVSSSVSCNAILSVIDSLAFHGRCVNHNF
ncbi:uncharacterized protein E6C27_scaffold403G00510 [Cucumis melo var. makuwa]|uniref:Uncharacterized protein n=1 Tax=Cucumis melo var. makuwa TaxID=1194695 RepID=A0A5A7SXK6_CUCMM|nr:uncharacterized protein E6C27_scaffold403G00510 [Cucumis melo var. makuwa]